MVIVIALALAASPAVPARCPATRLSLRSDGKDGDFNGMSHAGTLLIVRNKGHARCSVDALPVVTFLDARGKVLAAKRRPPAGMHPGPVVIPVTLAPGQDASTGLRWVSGPVYDRSRCVDATRIGVRIGGSVLTTRGGGHLCGEAGKPIGFDQSALRRGKSG